MYAKKIITKIAKRRKITWKIKTKNGCVLIAATQLQVNSLGTSVLNAARLTGNVQSAASSLLRQRRRTPVLHAARSVILGMSHATHLSVEDQAILTHAYRSSSR